MKTFIVRFSAFGQIKIVKVEAESMQDACIKAQPLIGYTLAVEPEQREIDLNLPLMFGEGK